MKEQSSNVGRTLDAIAGDIHQLERAKMFDIGKLLIEAEEACEHGRWRTWLKDEFEWSHDTARNYMAAYRLAENDERVRHLKVPATIIYALANDVDEITPKLIDALVEATADGRRLSVSDADSVIIPAAQRIKYGDYPEAALDAMAGVDGEPWGEAAIAALKAARPTTAEEARAIADRVWQAYEAERAGDPAEMTNEEKVRALINRAQHVVRCAHFDGTPDEKALRECRRAADAWTALADKLESDAAAQVKAAA
jgi:hypothetical protein